jgi:uncharacterized protein
MRTPVLLLAAVLVLPGLGGSRAAPPPDDPAARYTKFELEIPMRDGVKLLAAVYLPKGATERLPILLVRTPYSLGPYGPDRFPDDKSSSRLEATFSKELMQGGYILVLEDVRGRYMAHGEFANVRPIARPGGGPKATDESTDAYDTIEALVRRVPGHNGRVGILGISYPGFYAACALVGAHPALRAVSPQAPIVDWFVGDDAHHNGALMLQQTFNFLSYIGAPRTGPTKEHPRPFDHGTPDAYEFFLELGPLPNANARHFKGKIAFWNELVKHGTYDDFWRDRRLTPHVRAVRPAVLTVGGWFDAEDLYGTLELHRAIERSGPRGANLLVMGPWFHGGWKRSDGDSLGPVPFRVKTAADFREKMELPFFNAHLKGRGRVALSKATVFETGTNEWRSFDAWPPRRARAERLCLGAGGRLHVGAAPAAAVGASAAGFDEYVSDPRRPVPYTASVGIRTPHEFMTEDQRPAASRPDVLVYQTAPLEQDLTLAGPIVPKLFVSTSGTDSDFVVKLVDVYPPDFPDPVPNPREIRMGGYQQLVRGDVMRGKFRRSLSNPEPFVPGQVTPLELVLPDVLHTFRRGHRVMVQIQSSWFPLVDRNPQRFVDIYAAKESDFQKATERVYHAPDHPSCLEVRVLPPRL